MFLAGIKIVCVALLLATACLSDAVAQATVVSNPANLADAKNLPPEFPVVKPPVELFRELLAMTPAERRRALADRSADSLQRILAKLQEYESLRADDRELRLQATELRWYLIRLMGLTPGNRAEALANLPGDKRALIEARLQAWDKLPESARSALLDNQAAIAHFAETRASTTAEQQRVLAAMSPQSRERLEAGMARWRQLPETDRKFLLERFSQFFELTPVEKQKALATLSEPERRQIERTLKTFGGLTPEQRAKCIRGFGQFARMNLEERQQFLKNAERWQTMPPEQRQAWRDLVARLNVPPMPSDFTIPPLPPRNPRSARPSPVLTNVAAPPPAAPGS